MDSYSVGTTLALSDQLTPGLRRVSAMLRTVDTEIKQLQKGLKGLQIPKSVLKVSFSSNLPALDKEIQLVARHFNAAHNAAQKFSRTLQAIPTSVFSAPMAGLSHLAALMQHTNQQAMLLSRTLGGMRGPRAGGGGGGGYNRHGLFTPGFAHGYHDARIIGNAARHGLEPGFGFSHESALAGAQGLSPEEIERLQSAAYAARRGGARGLDVTEMVKLGRELYPIAVGAVGLPHAMDDVEEHLPQAARMDAFLNKFIEGGVTHKAGASQYYNALRAGEILGLQGDQLRHFVDEAGKAVVASGGRLNMNDVRQFAVQAKGAGVALDPDWMLHYAPELAMELGGSKMGTMAQTFFQKGVGVMTQRSYHEAVRLGLLDPSKVTLDHGKIGKFTPDAWYNSRTMLSNPKAYWEQTLKPALLSHGVDVNDKVAVEAVLATLYNNRNAAEWMSLQYNHGPQQDRFSELVKRPDLSYDKLVGTDATASLDAFTASWRSFETALTESVVPKIIPALNLFGGTLDALATWMTKHQAAAGTLGVAAAVPGTSAALMAGGFMASLIPGGAAIGALASSVGAATLPATIAMGSAYLAYEGLDDKRRLALPNYDSPSPFLSQEQDDGGPGVGEMIAEAIKKGLEGVTVTLNSYIVGKLIAKETARQADGPASSTSSFDPSMSQPQPGGLYSPY